MKNLFEREAVDEILVRIDTLQPSSQRKWGKMDVAQMMAHCSGAIGALTPQEWARGSYKHLDHHLRQFGA